ncbi:hypothetical protein ACP70R_011225 [Stipagrostis hirtigluma subsp. patula]
MVAVVAVEEARHAAMGSKPTEEEEGRTKKPPPAAPARRRPTPDHPPYCWMIGEAIDELREDGGSPEDSISAFIRARYPGVPAAHDRLLRHYLAKHVAEGFFVCTPRGRYARSANEAAVVDATPVEPAGVGASELACVGSPVMVAKRGRGRPRKDGSTPPSGAGKKDSSGAAAAKPKRRGQRRDAAPLAIGKGSVPTSTVAAAGKDRDQATSSTPRRRGRLRKLGLVKASAGSGEALVTDKGGDQATSSTPRRRGRLRKLELVKATAGSGKALVTDKDGGDAPSTRDKEHGRSHELALMIVPEADATTFGRDSETPPPTPMDHDQPCELALVTATDMDKDGGEAPSANLALMVKHDAVATTSTVPEESSQAFDLALVAADRHVPALVADEKDGDEVPCATLKPRRRPRKVAPVEKEGGKALSATPRGCRRQRKPARVAAGNSSAPTLVAGKKAGSKVRFAMPKLALVAAGGGSSPASVAGKKDGKEAPSVSRKPHGEPRKLYPLTAEEIPDDPAFCLLALPAQMPAAANA